MGIEQHMTEYTLPQAEISTTEDKEEPNPKYITWMNNDGSLTSRLLGTISEEVLAMIEGGTENAHQVWIRRTTSHSYKGK